jgi:TM2 domain-containing membrane protein YozV
MALIACTECGKQISDQASACPHCGAPLGRYVASTRPEEPRLVKSAKSRGVYIILGLFFGFFGIHNFYAGRFGVGAIQLITVLVLGWFVVGFVIVGIWVFIEFFIVTKDGAGDPFA